MLLSICFLAWWLATEVSFAKNMIGWVTPLPSVN